MFSYHVHPDITDIDDLLEGSDIETYLQNDDKVVSLTKWSPLSHGGQSFKSHKLVQVDDDHIEFRMSLQSAMVYMYITLLGLFTMVLSVFGNIMGFSGSGSPLIFFAVGLLFSAVGLFLYYKAKTKVSISRTYPAIYNGDIDPAQAINPNTIDGFKPLHKLHSIQVLQKYIESTIKDTNNSYFSYEINLIMNDGTRINVVDHGNRKAIIKQSNKLAEFLDVPLWRVVWDESSGSTYKMYRFFKTVGFLVILVIGALFVWNIYNDQNVLDKQKAAIEALSPAERTVHNAKMTAQLFELVRSAMISFPTFNKLIRDGADIYAKDEQGRSLLYYAVLTKNGDYIGYLISKGADLNTKDSNGLGLKDLLDPIKDEYLYYSIVDAELSADARKRGKMLIGVSRKFDTNGNLTHQEVTER